MSDKWCPENDGAYRAELAYIEKHASASRDAAEIARLRADLASAQEREQRMREALAALILDIDGKHLRINLDAMHDARAALGEPQ